MVFFVTLTTIYSVIHVETLTFDALAYIDYLKKGTFLNEKLTL
jgi:hypothetical protein